MQYGPREKKIISNLSIIASMIPSLAFGPPMFIIGSYNLHTKEVWRLYDPIINIGVTPKNVFIKYANVVTLAVPASHSATNPTELEHIDAYLSLT